MKDLRQSASITIESVIGGSFIATKRAMRCAAMFGLDLNHERERLAVTRATMPLAAATVVFITGPSGGGKSTMLRAIADEARRCGRRVIDASSLSPPRDAPLVDCIDTDTLPEAMRALARAGLAEARVFLRRPSELSDGQKARFELARLMHESSKHDEPAICIVDEFGSSLDRLTAQSIGMQVRTWTKRTGNVAVLAAAHEDLIVPLEPDVVVHIGLDSSVEVLVCDD